MQNKKNNKYFETQDTKPSRASNNVKKRSSIKKDDYNTGLFSGGNGSNVSRNAPKIQKPQSTPKLTQSSQRSTQFNPIQAQPEYRPTQNNFTPKQNVAYSGQGPIIPPQPTYGDDWQGGIDAADPWFDSPFLAGLKMSGDIKNPVYRNYSSPFDAYNPVKKLYRKKPIVDTDMFSKKPNIQYQTLPHQFPKGYPVNRGYSQFEREQTFGEKLKDFILQPTFKQYSD